MDELTKLTMRKEPPTIKEKIKVNSFSKTHDITWEQENIGHENEKQN